MHVASNLTWKTAVESKKDVTVCPLLAWVPNSRLNALQSASDMICQSTFFTNQPGLTTSAVDVWNEQSSCSSPLRSWKLRSPLSLTTPVEKVPAVPTEPSSHGRGPLLAEAVSFLPDGVVKFSRSHVCVIVYVSRVGSWISPAAIGEAMPSRYGWISIGHRLPEFSIPANAKSHLTLYGLPPGSLDGKSPPARQPGAHRDGRNILSACGSKSASSASIFVGRAVVISKPRNGPSVTRNETRRGCFGPDGILSVSGPLNFGGGTGPFGG